MTHSPPLFDLAEAASARDYTAVLLMAEDLRDALERHREPDRGVLGDANYYAFLSLVQLRRGHEALVVFQRGRRELARPELAKAAWMHEVAAGIALRQGANRRVVRSWLRDAMALRADAGQPAVLARRLAQLVRSLQANRAPELTTALVADLTALTHRAPHGRRTLTAAQACQLASSEDWFDTLVPGEQDRARNRQLTAAAEAGDTSSALGALAAGADANARVLSWPSLPTPLLAAAVSGDTDLLGVLLHHGADLAATNCQGQGALHLAADQGHARAVRFLAALGASVNARDHRGRTALHAAAAQGHPRAVSAMVGAGATVDARDQDGHRPVDLALAAGAYEVVGALASVSEACSSRSSRATLR